MSTERVIVQRRASEKLIPKITDLCAKLRAGDPITDPSVQLAALFNPGSAEGVIQMIKEAEQQGAQVLLGNKARDGAVVQPHVLVGVKPGMRAWDRESFGPRTQLLIIEDVITLLTDILSRIVVGITVVDTVDEAVELANATDYSLVASLWTTDLNVGLDVAGRIRAGMLVLLHI
jgi:acyl-CoA reductase-like NAD-dependent aldehyde dehydrogenase